MYSKSVDFNDLIGKTLDSLTHEDGELHFVCTDDTHYKMYHDQNCCEEVELVDECGHWDDIIGYEILEASEEFQDKSDGYGLEGWTFYKIVTNRGYMTLRWEGSSNGYYSIGVSFYKLTTED